MARAWTRTWRRRRPSTPKKRDTGPSQEELDRRQAEVTEVLASRALETLLQPIMDLKGGASVGVEALSRFPGPGGRPPDVWFAQAASVGLGVDLEMLAISKALDQLSRLPSGLYLSINASAETIVSDRFKELLASIAAERVVLEVTEHAKVSDYGIFRQKIQELRRLGLRLAVDDAGAGYASFRHVLNLRPDVIKLDIGLTRGIDMDPARQALGSALLTFGLDAYRASMVAEGIETAGELDTLRALGYPLGQGFYLARPGRLRLPGSTERTKRLWLPGDPRQAPVPGIRRAPTGSATAVVRLEVAAQALPVPAAVEDTSVLDEHRDDYAELLALAAEIQGLRARRRPVALV